MTGAGAAAGDAGGVVATAIALRQSGTTLVVAVVLGVVPCGCDGAPAASSTRAATGTAVASSGTAAPRAHASAATVLLSPLVTAYLRRRRAQPRATELQITRALVAEGVTRRDAALVVQLGPVAFGRALIRNQGSLSEVFVLSDKEGRDVRVRKLAAEPIFQQLQRAVAAHPELAERIGAASVEVRAVRGASGDGLIPGPVAPAMVFEEPPSDAGRGRAAEEVNRQLRQRTQAAAEKK